jgi:hypothetical protein
MEIRKMIRKFVLALALLMVPGAAMAQHHEHAKPAAAKTEHVNFAQELIAAQADLKLTAEQIKKLEVFSAKMDEMHKKMAAQHTSAEGHAAHGTAAHDEGKMHAELLKLFSEEQLTKVRPMMKAHMEKCEMMKDKQKQGEHKH